MNQIQKSRAWTKIYRILNLVQHLQKISIYRSSKGHFLDLVFRWSVAPHLHCVALFLFFLFDVVRELFAELLAFSPTPISRPIPDWYSGPVRWSYNFLLVWDVLKKIDVGKMMRKTAAIFEGFRYFKNIG